MATILQHRRGNTAQTAAYLGNAGEFYINTDKNQINVHDGANVGGWPVATVAGYTPGGFLLANNTGSLQNTTSMTLVAANNTIIANTDFRITGNLTVVGTTTQINQEIVLTSEIIQGQLTANSGASSTSTSTGALTVNGGAGITGNIYAGAIQTTGNVQASNVNATGSMTINSVRVPTFNDMLVFNLALG